MSEKPKIEITVPEGYHEVDLQIHAADDGKIGLRFDSVLVAVVATMDVDEGREMLGALAVAINEAKMNRGKSRGGPL